MVISFISVGKIKESYFVDAINQNIKELKKVCLVHNIEVSDEKCPEKYSKAEMEIVKKKEGERILSKIDSDTYVIALAIEGEQVNTSKLKSKIIQIENQGKKHIAFVIGGSLGLSSEVSKRANYKLSFSKMTFPHQLMKVILTEQIKEIYTMK